MINFPPKAMVKIFQKREVIKEDGINKDFLGIARVGYNKKMKKQLVITSTTRYWQYGNEKFVNEHTANIREFILEEI